VIVDAVSGWLADARRVESPNRDARPADATLDLIVVHGISLPPGDFGGPWIDQLFTNALNADAHPYFAAICTSRVSAHVLVDRRGGVTQYVPFHLRAWHAGRSQYRGRPACNDFSIGIELEGTDALPYEAAQYDALAAVVGALRSAYATLATAPIVGHSDVAPGRKTDPGPTFDWLSLGLRLRGPETA
jgi:AmpD protein